MSINWVMTAPDVDAFVKLPNEQILYKSPPRTTLELATGNTYPGSQPFSVKSDGGIAYVTNQRIVYLPANPTPTLQNFSCPILSTQDTFVRAPFFGSNYWQAAVRPVAGGGIPSHVPVIDLKMYFREGGAYDFHSTFVQIKERLYNAVRDAREEGRNVRGGPMGGVDMNNIHLDQLPAYEPAGDSTNTASQPTTQPPSTSATDSIAQQAEVRRAQETAPPPNEPPPGYEEAQMQAVGIDLDRRLRDEASSR